MHPRISGSGQVNHAGQRKHKSELGRLTIEFRLSILVTGSHGDPPTWVCGYLKHRMPGFHFPHFSEYHTMTAENESHELPEWAREERQRDLAWIKENMLIFREASQSAFQGGGRGAIVVDTTSLPVEGMGHPFGYYLQATIEQSGDEDVQRMVAEYEPEREFVIVLLKSEE